jgi:hypothetical protein
VKNIEIKKYVYRYKQSKIKLHLQIHCFIPFDLVDSPASKNPENCTNEILITSVHLKSGFGKKKLWFTRSIANREEDGRRAR